MKEKEAVEKSRELMQLLEDTPALMVIGFQTRYGILLNANFDDPDWQAEIAKHLADAIDGDNEDSRDLFIIIFAAVSAYLSRYPEYIEVLLNAVKIVQQSSIISKHVDFSKLMPN